MKNLYRAFLLTIAIILQCSCQNRESEIFILPENYNGYALVIFNQKDGEEPKYFEGKRLYIIPDNGILKTQFEAEYGYAEKFDAFSEEVDEKNRLLSGIIDESLSDNKVSVCCYSTGKAYSRNNKTISYLRVFVGTKSQVDKISKEFEKMDISSLLEN